MPKTQRPAIAALLAAWFIATPAGAADSRASDLWKEAVLMTTYTLNRHLNPFDLEVEVRDGVAYLGGSVESEVERDLAVQIAEATDGITKVVSNIRVQPAGPPRGAERGFAQTVQDATTTASVKSKLLWNRNTSGLDIDVDTRNGVVVLTGSVESDLERRVAERIAASTNGVHHVDNRLRVGPPLDPNVAEQARQVASAMGGEITDTWITTKVLSSLALSKSVDADRITVTTRDGVVTLTGTLETAAEREQAIRIVSDVVGVKEVKSLLEVETEPRLPPPQ